MHPLYIEVAGFSPAIHCEDSGLFSYLDRELATFKGGHGDDTLLCVELTRDSALPDNIPGDFSMITLAPGLQVLINHQNRASELLLQARACQSSEYPQDDEAWLYPMLLNTLLTFYLQRLESEGRAHVCLIHACGAIRDGRAFLFAGRSGAGKSTMGRLLLDDAACDLLGDDMIPLSRTDSGWLAHTSPLGGDVPRSGLTNFSAPLEVIYFLTRGNGTCRSRLETAEALALLMSSVVPAHEIRNTAMQAINEYDQGSLTALMREASALASEIPCYSLTYPLDEPPWEQIFQTDRKGSA